MVFENFNNWFANGSNKNIKRFIASTVAALFKLYPINLLAQSNLYFWDILIGNLLHGQFTRLFVFAYDYYYPIVSCVWNASIGNHSNFCLRSVYELRDTGFFIFSAIINLKCSNEWYQHSPPTIIILKPILFRKLMQYILRGCQNNCLEAHRRFDNPRSASYCFDRAVKWIWLSIF